MIDAPGAAAWRRSFGPRWQIVLAVMALVVFCFGAVRPLSDPDLPMHLAVGEWIVRHGTVPFVEPFAWTRPGEPYFAYSWLLQTTFYLVFRTFGHLGLRAVHGLFLVASAWSVLVLARAAGWRPAQGVMLAGLHLIIAALFAGFLRPQLILFVTLPLAWAMVHRIASGDRVAGAAGALFAASAITANSHLFFPLVLAPAILLLVRPPARRMHGAAAIAAVLAGWLVTPYASSWPAVFAHNFGRNILFRPPSAVTELQPGFVTMLHPAPSPIFLAVALMLAVPWVLGTMPMRARERWMAALYWGLGLVVFGYATRLFIAWWLLAIVPTGWAVAHLTRDSEDAPPRAPFQLLALAAVVLVLGVELHTTRSARAMEGSVTSRILPTFGARSVETLATWLQRRTTSPPHARVLTTFTFGSYLTWRLPGYSASMDSRGVFPDSVSAAEAVVGAADRDVPLGPWRSADVAIVPIRFRVAAVLDTAAEWRRLASAPGEPARDSTGLWARREWWARYARVEPSSPAPSR